MKDLGPVKDILGINIQRDAPTEKIKLPQQRDIANLLQKFGMENCKPILTPLKSNQRLTKKMDSNAEEKKNKYKAQAV